MVLLQLGNTLETFTRTGKALVCYGRSEFSCVVSVGRRWRKEWVQWLFLFGQGAQKVLVARQGGRRSWVVEVRSWEDVVVSGRHGWSGRKHPNTRRGRVRMGGAATLFLK